MKRGQREKAAAAVEQLGIKACDVCDNPEWGVVDIIEAQLWDHANRYGSYPTIPLLLVQCTKCGHVLQFSAVALGLVSPADIPEPSYTLPDDETPTGEQKP